MEVDGSYAAPYEIQLRYTKYSVDCCGPAKQPPRYECTASADTSNHLTTLGMTF